MPWILTLHEDEERSQNVDDIHCNNHKPQHNNHPSLNHDAKQCDSKRRLAKGARHDCQTLANVAQERHFYGVIRDSTDNFEVLPQS